MEQLSLPFMRIIAHWMPVWLLPHPNGRRYREYVTLGTFRLEPENSRFNFNIHKRGMGELYPHFDQTLLCWFSNFGKYQNHPECLLKHRFLGPAMWVYDSRGLGWNLRTCICNKFIGSTAVPGPGTTLWEPLVLGPPLVLFVCWFSSKWNQSNTD